MLIFVPFAEFNRAGTLTGTDRGADNLLHILLQQTPATQQEASRSSLQNKSQNMHKPLARIAVTDKMQICVFWQEKR